VRDNEVILRCQRIVERAGKEALALNKHNFIDYTNMVFDIMGDWSTRDRNAAWVKPFLIKLHKLRDDFEERVKADPMILYKPRHHVAFEFHQSQARIRYTHGGNRTSKTMPAIWEIWAAVTGSNPWRPTPALPVQVAVIGYDFTNYSRIVFEPKYVEGEGGNPLSPVFPVGGKWLHRYRRDEHTLEIACPECARLGKAGRCKHPKSKIHLFSDEQRKGDKDTIAGAGGQMGVVHIDEQVQRRMFVEFRQRMLTVPNSFMMITETPLKGKTFWTWREVATMAIRGDKVPGTDIPIAEKFTIDQFSAGLISHEEIMASIASMTEAEIRARVFGEPMVAIEKAIFDPNELSNMADEIQKGKKKGLEILYHVANEEEQSTSRDQAIPEEEILQHASAGFLKIAPYNDAASDLTVFEPPQPWTQYAIGCDVAQGLTRRDYSVADVMKMTPVGGQIQLEQVAQFRGWVNPLWYAPQLFKLGLWYGGEQNPAELVIERNGPGMALIQRLDDIGCWFMFQNINDPAMIDMDLSTRYGIDTTIQSKSVIVAALQGAIKARKHNRPGIILRSKASISELESYVQEPTETGRSFRFQSAGTGKDKSDGDEGGHDDCVMSAALVTYAVKMFGLFDWGVHEQFKKEIEEKALGGDAKSKRLWKQFREEEDKKRAIREYKQGQEGRTHV
jgi:hypothetical protein